MRELQIRNVVKGWYDRARTERNPVSSFVFLWFCFNAWLAYESEEDRDWQMMQWLKGADATGSELKVAYELAMRSETFRRHLEALVILSPIARTGRREGEFVEVSSPEDVSGIVDGIYVVRCNLFHGTKAANDLRDEKLVKVCGAILRKWVGNLVGAWRRAA